MASGGTTSGSWTRSTLLRAGRASIRVWLRHVPAADPLLLAEARRDFDRLSGQVPWPGQPVLRLHLAFSVLPGAAIYRAMRERGRDADTAADAVTRALVTMAAPRHRVLQRLTRRERGRRVFMAAAQRSLRAFPPPGWQATWVERTPHRVAFDMTRCFDLDMLRLVGAEAIAPAYCAVDDVLYLDLCPELCWARTGTLATGAPRCDFRFEHHPSMAARL